MLQVEGADLRVAIGIALVVIILAITVVLAIVNYKRSQELHLKEKKIMQEEFEKQLLKSQIEVQESTFSALGKELHDNVGQLLSSTKMLLGITQRNLEQTPDTLITAEETLGQAINELRSLSKSLSKEWLEQFNFTENLQAEADRINAAKCLNIHLVHTEKLPLKADEQVILFRIVQEAMQNAIRHARAQNITIDIIDETGCLKMYITDDGQGFEESEHANGVGILNMKHRTQLLGGTVEWQSLKEKGTTVIIQLPVKAVEQ